MRIYVSPKKIILQLKTSSTKSYRTRKVFDNRSNQVQELDKIVSKYFYLVLIFFYKYAF